ncbi:MAG TPA: hypothetical protein VFO58_06875 [Vicinamibacterales bacterium]|nr:hypothetical protein [Vicinamibacterales bacterium]
MRIDYATVALLVLAASAEASAQTAAPAAESLLQGYSIVLVQGDMQSASSAEGLPKAAQQALSDLKDFLPYKAYALLDSGWVLGPSSAATRLRGPSGQDLQAQVTAVADDEPRHIRINFELREASPSRVSHVGNASLANLTSRQNIALAERHQLTAQYESARKKYNDNHPDVRALTARLNQSAAQLDFLRREIERFTPHEPGTQPAHHAGTAVLIDSSFTMLVGETVVVGTSRVGGDKALIALLTAVPRNSRKE